MKKILTIIFMLLCGSLSAQKTEFITKYVNFDTFYFERPTKWVFSFEQGKITNIKNGFIEYKIIEQHNYNANFYLKTYNTVTKGFFDMKYNRSMNVIVLIDYSDNTKYYFYSEINLNSLCN